MRHDREIFFFSFRIDFGFGVELRVLLAGAGAGGDDVRENVGIAAEWRLVMGRFVHGKQQDLPR
jgi:hypothetical protein